MAVFHEAVGKMRKKLKSLPKEIAQDTDDWQAEVDPELLELSKEAAKKIDESVFEMFKDRIIEQRS